jgi:TRAP-type C4-dicarboxylate transport system permease small subunit
MNRKLVAELLRLCACFVKAFCAVFFGLLIFTTLSWVFGIPELGYNIFSVVFPWLLKIVLVIGCLLVVISLSAGL